jgi:uncharacterized protein (TIGR02145 family)
MNKFMCMFLWIGVISLLTISCSKNESKPNSETITDIDGNVYNSVKIGTQTWMVENLKTTKYRNGDPIANETDNTNWRYLSQGAYCWYNHDITNKSTYGALYNFWAVADSRKIAPTGWHVPTNAEWNILFNFYGGEVAAGGKLKESGTSHWSSPNTDATNSNGFTALPGGALNISDFAWIGEIGIWWSSPIEIGRTGSCQMDFNEGSVYRDIAGEGPGYSVRCVKD